MQSRPPMRFSSTHYTAQFSSRTHQAYIMFLGQSTLWPLKYCMQLCKYFGLSTGRNVVVNVCFTLATRPSVVAYCLQRYAHRGYIRLATRILMHLVRYHARPKELPALDVVRTALLGHPVFITHKPLSYRVGADCLPHWFILYQPTKHL